MGTRIYNGFPHGVVPPGFGKCSGCGGFWPVNEWCPTCYPERSAVRARHYPTDRSVWPCPVCPDGTEYFRDVSLPDGKVIEYRCGGCGYKHREERK